MLLYKGFGNCALLCHVNVVYSFYSSGFENFILLLIYWSILWLKVNCMNRSLYPIQDEIIISYCSIVKWFFLWCCAHVLCTYLFFQTVFFIELQNIYLLLKTMSKDVLKVAKFWKVFYLSSHIHQNERNESSMTLRQLVKCKYAKKRWTLI